MDWSVVLEAKARARKRAIVFPEGDNPIIREAAVRLAGQGLLEPVLIRSRADALPHDEASGPASPADGPRVRPMDEPGLEAYAAQLSAERALPLRVCRRMVAQPLLFAAMMVRNGEADGMVAGIDCPTGDVILAGGLGIGLRQGLTIPSSFYVMEMSGFEGGESGCLVFADPAVNPAPTPSELADIAICTADSVRALLGWEPRIAMLSFSTRGSGNHPDVDKVVEAVRLVVSRAPGLKVDGEMQVDAALLPHVAEKKMGAQAGPVAGRANILVFPDLDAANMASKLVQVLAKARLFGPVLQGFARPLSDLSRNATVRDVMDTALLVSAQAE